MRILHFSDTHVDPANHKNTVPALAAIVEKVVENPPDLVVCAGDLFDTRNRIDPTSLWYVRSAFSEIRGFCPVVVVPGNHDAANEHRTTDSATAALAELGIDEQGAAYPIHVFGHPGIYPVLDRNKQKINIAAMPAPSKFHYKAALANKPDGTTVDEAIVDVLRGMASELATIRLIGEDGGAMGRTTILVYHGAVKGGTFDNGRVAGEGMGVEIPRDAFEGPWAAVLAGDLHSHQEVGRVVYSGAIAPLNFNLEGYHPVMLDWTIDPAGKEPAYYRPIEIPVTHQLLTVDVIPDDLLDMTPTEAAGVKLAALDAAGDLDGAIVRVRLKLPDHRVVEWDEEQVRAKFPGVFEWKFQLERLPALRIRGENVTVTTSIEELLDEWANINPELREIEGALKALANRIDSELPGAAFLGTTGEHYRPIAAEARNYMQYRDAAIPFDRLRQLNCLNGPNMSGKSNAARIEPIALYGKKALNDGMALKDLVRNGEREAEVNLEYETGSTEASRRLWRVERKVKIAGNGTATGGLNLMRWATGTGDGTHEGWASANGADQAETQEKINGMVGSPEVFFRTRFARQGDVDAILDMKPAALKDMITDAMNAQIFDLRRAAAKAEASTLAGEISTLEGRIDGLLEAREDEVEINVQIAEKTAQQTVKKAEVETGRFALEGLADKRDEINGLLESIDEVRRNFADRQKRILDAGKVLGRVASDIESSKTLTTNESMINSKLERLGEVEELVTNLDKIQLAKIQLESDRSKVRSTIVQKESELRQKIEIHEKEIERLERDAKLLASVPCQDPENFSQNPTDQVHNDPENFEGCQFLLNAVAASGRLPQLKVDLAELKAADPFKLEAKQLRSVDEEIERLNYDESMHKDAKKELKDGKAAGWASMASKIAEARGRIDSLEKQLDDKKAEIHKLELERDKFKVDEAEASGLAAENKEIADAQQLKNNELTLAQNAVNELGQDIARLQGRLEANTKAKDSIESANGQLEKLRSSAAVYEAYVKAVSRDGIPFLLLERAIPSLQSAVNEILSEAPVSIEIAPLRELASGNVADGVSIRYHDQNGVHPLPTASGFQRQVLGMALRAGVAELEQLASGFRVELVYIDEGFGAFDGENLEIAHDVLRRIARRFEKVIYITHIDQLKTIADASIRIVPSPDGSKIEVG